MRVKEDFPLSPVDVQHSAVELVAPRARSCPCLPACARCLAFKATNEQCTHVTPAAGGNPQIV